MKRVVLVTGASGYIGALLCPKLADAGFEVLGIDVREPAPEIAGKITFHRADAADAVTLKKMMAKADAVIPMAAIVGAPSCDKNPELAKSVNLESVRDINRFRSPGQIVIFPMTNNGYRLPEGVTHADETMRFETDSLYTLTKFQAEQELLGAGNAVSLRLASLFGVSPGMRWDLLTHFFIRQALETGKLSLYEGSFKRNFVHASDAADAFVFALQNFDRMKNEIFNVACESANITKEELAFKVKACLPQTKVEILSQGTDPDARNCFIAAGKLQKAGFQASRTLDQGIFEVAESFKTAPLKGAA